MGRGHLLLITSLTQLYISSSSTDTILRERPFNLKGGGGGGGGGGGYGFFSKKIF